MAEKDGGKGMSGYFGIGVEGISKPMNAGSLLRTANAFGASFAFTIGAAYRTREGNLADTSRAAGALPFYQWRSIDELVLPQGCVLVGVELLEQAVDLPRYRHPKRAAYVLGPERGTLSPALLARCDDVIKIPTRFCLNVALAGALVMYDRLVSSPRFGERPVVPGAAGWRRPNLPDPATWRPPRSKGSPYF